jgi:hypothetical protein
VWMFLFVVKASYREREFITALTAEKVSLAKTLIMFFMSFKLSGTIKYPNLQPPAPHHLLRPVLIIVFSGQKFEIDL